jgi:hypothetical protein
MANVRVSSGRTPALGARRSFGGAGITRSLRDKGSGAGHSGGVMMQRPGVYAASGSAALHSGRGGSKSLPYC